MFLKALQQASHSMVNAGSVSKADGPFICPQCGRDVVAHKGTRVIHHFKHKPDARCNYGRGMTLAHLQARQGLADSLPGAGGMVEEEYQGLEARQPDVYWCHPRQKIAFEIQRARETPGGIQARTRDYTRQGVATCWIVLGKVPRPWQEVRIPAWQRFVHKLAFGVVLYWLDCGELQPVHFRRARRHTPTEIVRDEAGFEQEVGGTRWCRSIMVANVAPWTIRPADLTVVFKRRERLWVATLPRGMGQWWKQRKHPNPGFEIFGDEDGTIYSPDRYLSPKQLGYLIVDREYYAENHSIWVRMWADDYEAARATGLVEKANEDRIEVFRKDPY